MIKPTARNIEIRRGKIKERTFDKNGSFSMFLEVSTLGYFASHYRVMRRKLHGPEGSDDEVYDLVTALIFRGFQRLTEETGKEDDVSR